ncbi:Uncharacterised protein [Klebsiella pneumoniae]|uniref:Uncharacterized protein n=1 Tax=Klebsiella pneumoniae TaxID=573 RepID=A0A2X1Q9G3_KLEPN|nr:Uncharacterised protein [Klebsiella pneumoniae]SPX53107.1 Uncharacterised protein [Klebsiella pneumoniae]
MSCCHLILYCNTFLQCTRSHRYVGTGIVAQTFVYARRWEGRKVGSYRSYPVTTPSGFGGDWQVRQQLPVGVGPDDRMPPGSREPKVRRQTGQHCSSQNQSRKKKRIITGKVMSFLTTGHKQRKRRRRTGAAGARSSPFPKGNGLPGSLVVHARTMPARRKGPPANQQPLYKGASVQSDQHQP